MSSELVKIETSTQQEEKRRGKYRSSLVKKIIEETSIGEPITKVVKKNGITWNTWNAWCKKDPSLDELFQKAKERSIYYTIDDVETLTRDSIEKARTGEYNMTTIKALDIHVRWKTFLAQKLASKIFGSEKEKLTLTSSQGQKLEIEWLK
jgi:hypothetical protein|tara:strand:- start:88 stop:537 length:450 start_codon:yes stop_codon:yes gene_type:complete